MQSHRHVNGRNLYMIPMVFGEKDIYFRGTGEQRPIFEGIRGTNAILGNRELKKTNFQFFGGTR